MSVATVLAIVVAILLILMLVSGALLLSKNAGRPRMSKWERLAITRETNKYLERKAAEAAFRKQAEAMGYETNEE